LFDPFGWFGFLPERNRHRLLRAFVIAVCAALLVLRAREWPHFLFKPLWLAEVLIYVVFIWMYAVRVEPVDRSRGVREIVFPLVAGVLPFAFLFFPVNREIVSTRERAMALFAAMTLFTSFTIWGMITLRQAFSVTVEARTLVTGGPYRLVRHPIYTGEVLTGAMVVILRFSPLNAALFALFLTLQIVRSRLEEQKLLRVFPAYRDTVGKSAWFWKA
jgi:protein-S-isoprenylcysteine O-methyltransferase Ste14